jgi:energy-coupling factor transport system permease protein
MATPALAAPPEPAALRHHRPGRERRLLHPLAWWCWALGLALAAARTTNPVLVALIVAVVAFVVAARRTTAPWSRAFGLALRLGVAVVVIRVVMAALLSPRIPGTVLFTLPSADLPAWAAGVSIGGPVTVELLLLALFEGLRLAAVIACVGAANSLASPTRLLRSMPRSLYEAGVVVTVGLSVIPQATATLARLRAARRLRGHDDSGLAALRSSALPLLEGSLEGALDLAASMDTRGYGRRADLSRNLAVVLPIATLTGLCGTAVAVYALLDAGSPAVLGLPVLAGAGLVLVGVVALSGRRSTRTRYRPDRWRAPELGVLASGVVAAVGMGAVAAVDPAALSPSVSPPSWPTLPILPVLAITVALIPAWVAPPVPAILDPHAPADLPPDVR